MPKSAYRMSFRYNNLVFGANGPDSKVFPISAHRFPRLPGAQKQHGSGARQLNFILARDALANETVKRDRENSKF
jgi:hypothetical protein